MFKIQTPRAFYAGGTPAPSGCPAGPEGGGGRFQGAPPRACAGWKTGVTLETDRLPVRTRVVSSVTRALILAGRGSRSQLRRLPSQVARTHGCPTKYILLLTPFANSSSSCPDVFAGGPTKFHRPLHTLPHFNHGYSALDVSCVVWL